MLIIETEDGRSEFEVKALRREGAETIRKKIAVDAKGRPCQRALMTEDGLLLPKGATADGYEVGDGDSVDPGEVVAVDAAGEMLRELPGTNRQPQGPVGPLPPEELLEYVALKAYALSTNTLAPDLAQSLREGQVFRVQWRPRKSAKNQPAFLLGNETGLFLLRCEGIATEWVRRENPAQWDDTEDDVLLFEAAS